MNRRTGLAIGAAAVSVTLGVLIGVVIHVGQSQHAASPASGATSIVASSQAPAPIVVTPPSQGDTAPSGGNESAAPSSGNESAAPTAAVEPSAPSSAALPSAALPSAAAPETPMTSEPPTAEAPATASPTPSGATTVTGAAAGAPCPSLAARSADPAGATLYCQVDPQTHVLQWRPVTDGGGCLSQKMTGQDAAGVQYVCRIDSTGHNHWVRA